MLIECESCAISQGQRNGEVRAASYYESTASEHRSERSERGAERARCEQSSYCDDCVVNALLSMPPVDGDAGPSVEVHEVGGVPLTEFDAAEQNAIALLADEGLIAPLYPEPRYVPVGAIVEPAVGPVAADDRKVG